MVLGEVDAGCRPSDRATARGRSDRTSIRARSARPGARRLERQDRRADIAADLRRRGRRCAADVPISAVVVDLPLVPVMATNGASGAWLRRSRQNSSMSPMTSTPAARASPTVQCGAGWVSGTPGASTSAAMRDQSISRRSAVANAGRGRLGARCLGIVVPGDDVGAAGERARGSSRAPSRRGRTPRPCLPAKVRDRDHRLDLTCSFRVERPISASTTAMIQKRITICGSVQPFCSK